MKDETNKEKSDPLHVDDDSDVGGHDCQYDDIDSDIEPPPSLTSLSCEDESIVPYPSGENIEKQEDNDKTVDEEVNNETEHLESIVPYVGDVVNFDKSFEQQMNQKTDDVDPDVRSLSSVSLSSPDNSSTGEAEESQTESSLGGIDICQPTVVDVPKYRFGCGAPPGPVQRKEGDDLVTLPHGSLLGEGSRWNQTFYLIRFIFTMGLAIAILTGMSWSYWLGFSLLHNQYGTLAFGVYGAFLAGHVALQYLCAFREHRMQKRRAERPRLPDHGSRKIALQVSAYLEDPDYLYRCLQSIKDLKYPRENLKILVCIDGNGDESLYMKDIFLRVFEDENPAFFRWDYNFHELPLNAKDTENGVDALKATVANHRVTCIMQKWGGKREVMYTAFRILQDMVDYIQVCDSDTILDPDATDELARVLDEEPTTGAVGGDVKILNDGDSFVSFLSSLRYWMAFNVERACQSHFGVVSCISGPLGMYRNIWLQEFLDLWSDQKFLGHICTFGDDRHLTNRMLQFGYATKYTAYAICSTETPAEYVRWLAQQTRWSKSFFREWLFNALWWHKHHPWMVYESIVSGAFPFFVMYTCLYMTWSGSLWNVIYLLLSIQGVGMVKGILASFICRSGRMVFISFYSCLYMTSLLPAKVYAIFTIRNKGWGTSDRRTLITRYNALIPVVAWFAILIPGLFFSTGIDVKDSLALRGGEVDDIELMFLIWGILTYIAYWIISVAAWKTFVRGELRTKEDFSVEDNFRFGDTSSDEVSSEAKSGGDQSVDKPTEASDTSNSSVSSMSQPQTTTEANDTVSEVSNSSVSSMSQPETTTEANDTVSEVKTIRTKALEVLAMVDNHLRKTQTFHIVETTEDKSRQSEENNGEDLAFAGSSNEYDLEMGIKNFEEEETPAPSDGKEETEAIVSRSSVVDEQLVQAESEDAEDLETGKASNKEGCTSKPHVLVPGALEVLELVEEHFRQVESEDSGLIDSKDSVSMYSQDSMSIHSDRTENHHSIEEEEEAPDSPSAHAKALEVRTMVDNHIQEMEVEQLSPIVRAKARELLKRVDEYNRQLEHGTPRTKAESRKVLLDVWKKLKLLRCSSPKRRYSSKLNSDSKQFNFDDV